MLRLYDTLAGDLVEFVPREAGKVSMYVCGPTVYDHPHLGHARSALTFDVIRRFFMWCGDDVTYAMNVTDIDDNIIKRAAERGSTEPEIAQTYEAAYFGQMDRLDVLPADHRPHATEYVEEMNTLIAEIVAAGKAYVVEGSGVYFDVESYADGYGFLPHRTVAQLRESAGARIEVDEDKRSPLDFVLWKAAKPGEPTWDSPFGPGRPGWHIECAAMSLDLLGERFDIHGGGKDLKFPHHENERVEAEAAGHPFARYWLHNGFVMIDAEKMSKSLGNSVTLQEALDEYDPRAIRMAVLQTQYRSDMDMGRSELSSSQEAISRLDALLRRARSAGIESADPDPDTIARFRTAMEDDFNTPEAIGAVFDAVRRANTAIDGGDAPTAAALLGAVVRLTGALGIRLKEKDGGSGSDDGEIDALVAQRDAARASKDFAIADKIRDDLAARGIVVEDTPTGAIWYRS